MRKKVHKRQKEIKVTTLICIPETVDEMNKNKIKGNQKTMNSTQQKEMKVAYTFRSSRRSKPQHNKQ